MTIAGQEYQQHPVFERLKQFADFYESLSDNAFRFISSGTTTPFNLDTYVFTSMAGTLESIHDILIKGRINDAFALLRKYYDSAIINAYCTLYLEDNCSLENFIVTKIDNWLKGTEQLPEFRVMSNYIRSSEKLRPINDLLYRDDRYKKLRDRGNDHTHYNFYHNVLYNDNKVHLPSRIKLLDRLSMDALNIFVLHFAYIFYLRDHYMASTDYVDALDCDMQPEPGSQYWVANFVQSTFDEVIKKHRADIAGEILAKTGMELG